MNNNETIDLQNGFQWEKPINIINKFAVYSTLQDDVIFKTKFNNPIYCGGLIKGFTHKVYNFRKHEFVGYISYEQTKEITLSPNIIFKISNEENLELISILPYASYAMKILRIINPKIGQNIVILGLNFFSHLLGELLKLSGAYVYIIKLKEINLPYELDLETGINQINGLKNTLKIFEFKKIDHLLQVSDINQINRELLKRINYKFSHQINQISVYDKGIEDPYYIQGLRYPYPYVRWDFHQNLQYFISLVEERKVILNILKPSIVEVDNVLDIEEKVKNIIDNSFVLFKILH